MTVRPYTADDIQAMTDIWNEVVAQGIAFPQEEPLNEQTAEPADALQGCIFFTRTTSVDADTSATQATR